MQRYFRLRLISKSSFLLASLHIEAILRETSITRRGKRLQAVKDGLGLGDAYGATLERIKAQGEERTRLAIATLTWICHAERPLQVDELCHALAVDIGATDFDSENAPSIGALLSCCQGLITVDKEASTVRLIHFTVQEYLCVHPDLFCQPHSVISEACLTYLNSKQIRNLSSHPLPDHQLMPFLEYSSRYWGTHANRELSDHARALALELLNGYENHVSAVSLLKQVLDPSDMGVIGHSPRFTGLHCASFFGIIELVTVFVNAKGSGINQGDCTCKTPLSWAATNGHDGVVKQLLERGDLDPDRPDRVGSTPLSWAAYNGHEGVVKLLLGRRDVDPNRPDNLASTPLSWAADNGHAGVVQILLCRKDVNPNRPDSQGHTALYWAANFGHDAIVKLLIGRKDVDLNRPGKNGRTPLVSAAISGHEGVVKLLLGHGGVDPNLPDESGWTPLKCAAAGGSQGIAGLLLERGDVDPNRPSENGRTPLGGAAERGHEGVVRLLLGRQDVDPNRPDNQGSTPLSWAAGNGHEGVVQLLLGRSDIDPNRSDENDQTPFSWAAENGHEKVVNLLLEHDDVDPNRSDKHDRGPLWWAAMRGHEGVVRLLQARTSVESLDAQSPY